MCETAITIDGCNVKAYVAWAIVDFMEWSDGFNVKFGFYHVDLNDPERPRSPKDSAYWFRQVLFLFFFINGLSEPDSDPHFMDYSCHSHKASALWDRP